MPKIGTIYDDVNGQIIGGDYGMAWATCPDDYGLEYGLGVSCTVDGFYFRREID